MRTWNVPPDPDHEPPSNDVPDEHEPPAEPPHLERDPDAQRAPGDGQGEGDSRQPPMQAA